MAGKKRRVRRKKGKKGPTTKALNKKINNIQNNLIELKSHEGDFDQTSIPQTGLVESAICTLTQGVGNEQRVGDSIKTTSLTLRMRLIANNGYISDQCIRVIVFWDRQCNGVATDLIGNADSLLNDNAATIPGFLAFQALHTQNRYKILYDKVHTLRPTLVASMENNSIGTLNDAYQTGVTVKHLNIYLKASRIIKYSGTSNSIANVVSNNLQVAWIGDGGTNLPSVQMSFRLIYRDG